MLVCYQFNSPDSNRGEIDRLILECCEQARDDLNRVRQDQLLVRPVLHDLLSRESSSAPIVAKIQEADLCVFESSGPSSTTSTALGYAAGQGKPCIYLQHEDLPVPELPADLGGVVVLRYTNQNLRTTLVHEICRRSAEIVDARIIQTSQRATQTEEVDILRAFWGLDGEQSIYLVCPEIPENDRTSYASPSARDYLRLAKFADIDSLFHLRSFVARYFPDIRIFECTCNEMPPNAYNENFMTIGGIAWNKLTAQVIPSINLPFVQHDGGLGNPDPILDDQDGSRYQPTISEEGVVQEDIGCFVKIPNPMNRERSLFLIYGILVHGVLGAAKCFGEGTQGVENCSFLIKRMGKSPNFAALFRVPVVNNFVGVPNIASRSTSIKLLGYSPERNEFA